MNLRNPLALENRMRWHSETEPKTTIADRSDAQELTPIQQLRQARMLAEGIAVVSKGRTTEPIEAQATATLTSSQERLERAERARRAQARLQQIQRNFYTHQASLAA